MLKLKECKKLMKKCKICGELKLISDFFKDSGLKDGHKNQCKICMHNKAKSRYLSVCLECGKKFTSAHKEQKFCSKECKDNHNREEVLCDCCGKPIKLPKNRIKNCNHHFCNKECKEKWNLKNNREEVLCDYCGKSIKLKKSRIKNCNHHFCSTECQYKWQLGKNNPNYNSEEILCDYCRKPIKVKKSKIKRSVHHFCSKKCKGKWDSENKKSENNPNYNTEEILCDYCKKSIKVIKSKVERSNHHFCDKKCYGKWKSENKKGENHPNWNPNLTDEDRQDRRQIEGYNDFIKQVLERDNYTCQLTGKRGGKLAVHHLNGYHWDKKHRTDINNAITLSKEVHELFHKLYGHKNNTKEQFEEFKHRYINKEFEEVG